MMQHQDLAFELPAGLRIERRRNHHHALANVRSLDLLQRETSCLTASHLANGHSLTVDAFHRYRRKTTQRIRP